MLKLAPRYTNPMLVNERVDTYIVVHLELLDLCNLLASSSTLGFFYSMQHILHILLEAHAYSAIATECYVDLGIVGGLFEVTCRERKLWTN